MLKLVKSFFILLCICIASSAFADRTSRFLSVTDIHFDPFITCNSITPCPIIEKLQNTPGSLWRFVLSKEANNPPAFGQDSNYQLFESALTEIKNTADAENVRFVLVLGDFLGHDYKEKFMQYAKYKTQKDYENFVNATMLFITSEFARTMLLTDIYFTVGNNDSYQDDYFSDPNGTFFKDMSQLWSNLIIDKKNRMAMRNQFISGGYYAVNAPHQPDLHIIILNSSLFSKKSGGNNIPQAANAELNWLHQELAAAHAKHQKSIIALHIPAGTDVFTSLRRTPFSIVEFWYPQYTQRFQDELAIYGPDIIGILPAHLHMDWFQVLTAGNHKILVSATPAISPLFGNKPSFKVFNYDVNSLQLEDFSTYEFLLNQGNQWQREYTFNSIYQPTCQNCQIINGMQLLQKANALANYYIYLYSIGTNSQPITTYWLPYYWCQTRTIFANAYQDCLNNP